MECRPGISVLLPFYQAERTLDAALRSLTRQTRTDWEAILVDDGSTDRGPQIARAAAARDPRIEVVRHDHGGLVVALSAGLELCRAPLVARMDADDLMHRERLAAQSEMLSREPDLAGVGCHVRIFPRRGLSQGMRAYERWLCTVAGADDVRREAFVECPLVHPSLLLRRDVLRAFGYRDAGWPEDYDLVLRLLARGHRLGVVPRRLLGWRDSSARLTRTGDAYRFARIVACKAFFLADTVLAGREHYVLWGHGPTARTLRRALEKHGRRPAFIVETHPRRIGRTIRGAAVIAPAELARIPRLPLVAAVSGPRPRDQIRAWVRQYGWAEGRDFVCAA
jgi:glycosyltransferase involved in cell wall biosynthesis